MQPYTNSDWNTLISQLPNPHFLQTREWAQVKEKYGWQAMPFVWYAGKQLVAAVMIPQAHSPHSWIISASERALRPKSSPDGLGR